MIDLIVENPTTRMACGCGIPDDEEELELYDALRWAMLNTEKFLKWYKKTKRD